ncbi:MAG: GNAT family N-acetyltransferase [Clostridiales bacterium]|nr:GNAT family N-acetyltransferase [Clostridiales bacterium]MDD7035326.1 GNAT family N-acetyltransferase [Bacillota bacterium]
MHEIKPEERRAIEPLFDGICFWSVTRTTQKRSCATGLSRGIRPCWDAANEISLHMALKLGYEYNGEYSTVHLIRPEAAGTR